MRLTEGAGVDVVLNSLAGDSLRETWQCLAPLGRFVEIGKRDIVLNEGFPMGGFGSNRLFAAVDLVVLTEMKTRFVGDMLRKLLCMASRGVLKPPVPLHVKPVSEIESAFRGLQSGKLAGKVVEMGSESLVHGTSSKVNILPPFQHIFFDFRRFSGGSIHRRTLFIRFGSQLPDHWRLGRLRPQYRAMAGFTRGKTLDPAFQIWTTFFSCKSTG